jgi:hypothetical protein
LVTVVCVKEMGIMMNFKSSRCLVERDILFLGSLYLLSDQNSQVM